MRTILIVDKASRIQISGVATSLAKQFPNLKIICLEKHPSITTNRIEDWKGMDGIFAAICHMVDSDWLKLLQKLPSETILMRVSTDFPKKLESVSVHQFVYQGPVRIGRPSFPEWCEKWLALLADTEIVWNSDADFRNRIQPLIDRPKVKIKTLEILLLGSIVSTAKSKSLQSEAREVLGIVEGGIFPKGGDLSNSDILDGMGLSNERGDVRDYLNELGEERGEEIRDSNQLAIWLNALLSDDLNKSPDFSTSVEAYREIRKWLKA